MTSLASRMHSALQSIRAPRGVRSIVFEATQECNQDCVFCYNVWKCADYPLGRLDTPQTKELLSRIITDYRPRVITFTGGEPLLRPDLSELVRHVSRRASCNLITNGTLMADDLAHELVAAGVKVFEFTLLSADRDTHNRLVGRDSFDRLIEGIASVRAAGGLVTTTFVAMKRNIAMVGEVIELTIALGGYAMLFNRFNVGGAGIGRARGLAPSREELRDALAVANEMSGRYGIGISCGVPIPPCVLDMSGLRNLHRPDCAVGTSNAYPAVDPLGNVRWCNHSAKILGNALKEPLSGILAGEAAQAYVSTLPEYCTGCEHARTCRGGCRAAAEVCGNHGGLDPFVCICGTEEAGRCAMSI